MTVMVIVAIGPRQTGNQPTNVCTLTVRVPSLDKGGEDSNLLLFFVFKNNVA